MKLYKVTWTDTAEGNRVAWAASKTEARRLLAEARRVARHNSRVVEGGCCVEGGLVVAVEVKPTKLGILQLLRTTPDHDNG